MLTSKTISCLLRASSLAFFWISFVRVFRWSALSPPIGALIVKVAGAVGYVLLYLVTKYCKERVIHHKLRCSLDMQGKVDVVFEVWVI